VIDLNSEAGVHNCEYFLALDGNSAYNCDLDIPESGNLNLTVTVDGEQVSGATTIPSKAAVSSGEVEIVTDNFYDFEFKEVVLTALVEDVPNEKNYYRVGYSYVYDPDEPLRSNPQNDGRLFYTDTDIDGGQITTTQRLTYFSSFSNVDTVYMDLVVQSLSESAFKYLSSTQAQEELGDLSDLPFSEPIPINGNIENGLGVFGALVYSEPIRISFAP